MPREKPPAADLPSELAQRLTEALTRERLIPRFVDSYVVENGRQALQVHAVMYRDLLTLLQREALLALTVETLAMISAGLPATSKNKPRPLSSRDAKAFRRKFLAALTRQQRWTAGEALDFQRDLQLYEDLLQRASAKGRTRKPFEVADHPFVDRCAFLLDSSFMETARLAASKALTEIEKLAEFLAANEQPAPRLN